MARRVGIEVSIAVSEAVKLADVDLIAAYPITPQTHIVEHLSELVADGELDAEFVPVESEHSAMSSCIGSSAAGARTYTATSSQGLALMLEVCYIASSLRLPIVMTIVDRSLSGPLSIWNDHSDLMMERDIGWIQIVALNGQEIFDMTLHSFKIAEDHNVMLPTQVHMDGFTLSHVIEPIEILDKAEVDKFLKPYVSPMSLDPEKPVTIGAVGVPEVYTEGRKAQEEALLNSKDVILRTWKEFGDLFGRYYEPIGTYKADDAEIIFITMGSITETCMSAVDQMRQDGKKVGIAYIRLWRPFPFDELIEAVTKADALVVIDRAISHGGPGGPLASEIKSALYHQAQRPFVNSFIAGLGGRDITINVFKEMVEKTEKTMKKGVEPGYEFIGVKE